jgi:hypothetical protein
MKDCEERWKVSERDGFLLLGWLQFTRAPALDEMSGHGRELVEPRGSAREERAGEQN